MLNKAMDWLAGPSDDELLVSMFVVSSSEYGGG